MEINGLQQIVAENLRYWRKTRNLTVSELALRAGLAKGTLSQLERGLTNPTLDTLWALAQALDVSFGALITRRADSDLASAVFEVADHMSQTILLDRNVGDFGIVETYHMTLSSGRRRQARAHPKGVFEVVVGIEGRCGVGPNDSLHHILPGDVVTFSADRDHIYESGPGGCHIIVLVFYPQAISEEYSERTISEALSWPAAWAWAHAHLSTEVFSGTVSASLETEIWRANDQSMTHRTFLSEMAEPQLYRFDIVPMGRMMTDKETVVRKKLIGLTKGKGVAINPTNAGKTIVAGERRWNWLFCEDMPLSSVFFRQAAAGLVKDGQLVIMTHLIDVYYDALDYQRKRLLYMYQLQLQQWPADRVVPSGHPIQETLRHYIHAWTRTDANESSENGSPGENQWIDATTLMERARNAGFRLAEHYRVAGTWSLSEWTSGRHAILLLRG